MRFWLMECAVALEIGCSSSALLLLLNSSILFGKTGCILMKVEGSCPFAVAFLFNAFFITFMPSVTSSILLLYLLFEHKKLFLVLLWYPEYKLWRKFDKQIHFFHQILCTSESLSIFLLRVGGSEFCLIPVFSAFHNGSKGI